MKPMSRLLLELVILSLAVFVTGSVLVDLGNQDIKGQVKDIVEYNRGVTK